MAGFLSTDLILNRLPGPRLWQVVTPFEYCVGHEDSPVIVRVYAGFVTDFASVPRGLWNIFPPVGGTYDKAALLHDLLYQDPYVYIDNLRVGPLAKAYADSTFLEAMGVLGVGWFTRTCLYHAVKYFGRHAWEKHRREDMVA